MSEGNKRGKKVKGIKKKNDSKSQKTGEGRGVKPVKQCLSPGHRDGFKG